MLYSSAALDNLKISPGCCNTVKQTIRNIDYYFNKSSTGMYYINVDYPSMIIQYR